MRPTEVVHRFLASIGRPEAATEYLELFQAADKERFAFIVIHPDVVSGTSLQAHPLLANLVFLQQLDLTPVLCLASDEQRLALLGALPREVVACPCDIADAAAIALAGKMPVIVASSEEERIASADKAKARKVVYLVTRSGLQPEQEKVRSLINLRTDFGRLRPTLRPEQQALFSEIQHLFHTITTPFTVSVTSAHDLLRELFTMKGAGTLIRRGTSVDRLAGYDEVDKEQFQALLQSAFHNQPRADFFERPVLRIFLAARYQGAAVVEQQAIAPYLSKFAVDLRAQGEGIGRDIWSALCNDYPRFFWRSRPNNPIKNWYASQCDGLVRGQEWTVYWRGLATSEIAAAVEQARAAGVDFEAKAS